MRALLHPAPVMHVYGKQLHYHRSVCLQGETVQAKLIGEKPTVQKKPGGENFYSCLKGLILLMLMRSVT